MSRPRIGRVIDRGTRPAPDGRPMASHRATLIVLALLAVSAGLAAWSLVSPPPAPALYDGRAFVAAVLLVLAFVVLSVDDLRGGDDV